MGRKYVRERRERNKLAICSCGFSTNGDCRTSNLKMKLHIRSNKSDDFKHYIKGDFNVKQRNSLASMSRSSIL